MKLKTRLQVTFLTIIILPLLLAFGAFGIIGNILAKARGGALVFDPKDPHMDVLFTPDVAKSLFLYMAIAIIIILTVTSVALTMWISKGVFHPINKLSIAMQIYQGKNIGVPIVENRKEG